MRRSSLRPPVGWPLFLILGVTYFATAYLLLGALFLSIGSLATTVRDVQTLSFPVTMMQLMMYLFATYAMSQQGSTIELVGILFPFSSPFVMLARAAQRPLPVAAPGGSRLASLVGGDHRPGRRTGVQGAGDEERGRRAPAPWSARPAHWPAQATCLNVDFTFLGADMGRTRRE